MLNEESITRIDAEASHTTSATSRGHHMKNLLQALSNMHEEFGVTLVDDKKGARSNYVSLPGVLEQITKMTSKHGLKAVQCDGMRTDTDQMVLITRLYHIESGECITSETILNQSSATPGMSPDQAWGGSCTYKRRYELMTILGLFCHGDETDNDGYEKGNEPVQSYSVAISVKQLELLNKKLVGKDDKKELLVKKYGSLAQVPWKDFQDILRRLDGTPEQPRIGA